MAARLILETEKKLDAKKRLSKGSCEAMDAVLMDVDASQALFEKAIAAVDETVAALGSQAGLDRRTAKMRDMRDSLRARLAAQSAPQEQTSVTA